jgi:carboxyl-terminal processing protease
MSIWEISDYRKGTDKMKRISRITLIITLLLLTGILFQGDVSAEKKTDDANREGEIYKGLKLLSEVLTHLQNYYVDEDALDPNVMIESAVRGMLDTLGDPYTRYIPPKKYTEMKIMARGKLGGIGIVIIMKDDQLMITSSIEDTPGFEAGLRPGDRIIKINGEPTKGIAMTEALTKLRGKPGTEVTITVLRRDDVTKDITITRAEIEIKSVKCAYMDDIAYIRLTTFSNETPKQLKDILEDISDKPEIKAVILDLRNNGGGLLTAALEVADMFIDTGLITYTRGRVVALCTDYPAHQDGSYTDFPLFVMANEYSASGSEIVIGAIKDHNRGVIVGKRTFGKGLVQTLFKLTPTEDNVRPPAVKVTTAKYYTPGGVCIQKNDNGIGGIEPDIEIAQQELPETDIESLLKLRSSELLRKFIQEHPTPSEEEFHEFKDKLKKEGIEFSTDNLLRGKIREQQSKERGEMVFVDLANDLQLQQAVKMLRAAILFRNIDASKK